MKNIAFILIIQYTNAWNNWGWGNQPPPAPNNNLAIGYPTAYGLYAGRGFGNYGGGGGPPNAGTGFGSPVRCLNGGAHIGQCRLDQDSICIALGGTCTHGACCTTPFVSILGVTTSTETPEVIDGETTKRKKSKRKFVTTTIQTSTSNGEDEHEIESSEIEEWDRLIENAQTSTTPETFTEELITVSTFIEENEDRKCESGLRSVGPCSEDEDCPTLHQCERKQCCYLLV